MWKVAHVMNQQMDQTQVEAASWALAAEVAAALGSRFTIFQGAPGGGTYDLLSIVSREALAANARSGPEVRLNRNGSLHAGHNGDTTPLRDAAIWQQLASGEQGVAAVAAEVLNFLGMPEQRSVRVEVLAWRVMASVMAQSALFRSGWTVQAAVADGAGWPLEVRSNLLSPYASQLGGDVLRIDVAIARQLWLVLDSRNEPVACVDTRGGLLRPDATGTAAVDISEMADDLALAAELATSLIHKPLTRDVFVTGNVTPGLGLPSVLSAFNRKERFFLTTQAAGLLEHAEIHGASLPLSPAFRHRLGAELGLDVPPHAFAATDYHLSWLHAALSWWGGTAQPHQAGDFPATTDSTQAALVDGSQEDLDLLICWQDQQGLFIVAVEAKAYGAWSNSQMTSKVARLERTRTAAEHIDLQFRLVLTSRREPQHLDTDAWEAWAAGPDGNPLFIPLSAPGLRLASMRCDEQGQPSSSGLQWTITGPAGA